MPGKSKIVIYFSLAFFLVYKYHIRDKELLEKLEIQKVAVKLLGLDIQPERIKATFDTEHLIAVHRYLFGDVYEWAGKFRDENFYKSERVLSGGVMVNLFCNTLFEKYIRYSGPQMGSSSCCMNGV